MKVKISQKSRSPFVFASNIFIGARVMARLSAVSKLELSNSSASENRQSE